MFTKGHLSDPKQAWVYVCMLTVRRLVRRYGGLGAQLVDVIQQHQALRVTPKQGPACALLEAMRQSSLEFVSLPLLQLRSSCATSEIRIDLYDDNRERFLHQLREALRSRVWHDLSQRRPTFWDAERGLNRKWSRWHWDHSSGELKKHARLVMTGATIERAKPLS